MRSYGGWEYRLEGDRFSNPKPGLVASTPGKRLELCWQPPQRWHKATIKLGYLTSYEQMGRANYSCSGACSCRAGLIDAYTHRRRSVHWVSSLAVVSTQGATRRRRQWPAAPAGVASGRLLPSITSLADPAGARTSSSARSRRAGARRSRGCTARRLTSSTSKRAPSPTPRSSRRVEGKSTLTTSRREGRHRGSRGGGPKGGGGTATGVGAKAGKRGGRRAKGRGRGRLVA